jgi:transcription elongation factor Elf1
MFEWVCPHCGKKSYSSCPDRDKDTIECCNCGQDMNNPYYEPEIRADEV